MAVAKQNYIGIELDWAQQQLDTWRDYIDTNPINELEDRIQWKTTKTGGAIPIVLSKKEDQIKCIRDTMKEYLTLLAQIDKLREIEVQKTEAKGEGNIPHRMSNGG